MRQFSLPGKLTTRSILSAPYEWFDLVEECEEVGAELFDLTKVIDSEPHLQLNEIRMAFSLTSQVIATKMLLLDPS